MAHVFGEDLILTKLSDNKVYMTKLRNKFPPCLLLYM